MDPSTLAIIGALALLVRIGHTFHTMGAVRARSVAAVAARALIGTASIILLTYAAGHLLLWWYSSDYRSVSPDPFQAGGMPIRSASPAIGPGVFFATPSAFLSILAIALLPGALLGGATAERARVRGLFVIVAFLTAVAMPVLTATGWVALWQIDQRHPDGSYLLGATLSGISLVWPVAVGHLLASIGGLTLAAVIGPRVGKYNRDGSANFIPAHSLPTMISGDLLLIIGLPMMAAAIAGDPAARVVHAVLAGSAATLGAVAYSMLRNQRVDVILPWNAALAGLVAGSLIGPGFGLTPILIGGLCGVIMPWLSLKADLRLRVDETSGLCLPHLIGALVGVAGAAFNAVTLETALPLMSALLVSSIILAGALVVVAAGMLFTLIPAIVLKRGGMLRVDSASEAEGLDLSQHDINAYPDFQQTLIKSYHLRQ